MEFQYNKTSMQKLERELAIRVKALPTLKAKETALRIETAKVAGILKSLEYDYRKLINENRKFALLWSEYPSLLSIKNANVSYRNIAGVSVPVLNDLEFNVREYSLFSNRAWVPGATELLKELVILAIQINLTTRGLEILRRVRMKTTQKVNLYEKVQIPEYQVAMRKIKRFLEDEENLSRAAQKIIKQKRSVEEVAS